MIRLAEKIFFVRGARNGAIYDLVRGRVFAVNECACDVISKAASGVVLSTSDREYILQLEANGLVATLKEIREAVDSDLIPRTESCVFDLVWLEVTQGCNLKCIHCYEGERHHSSSKRLSKSQWFSIIDQVSELGTKNVVVIGGEPSCCEFTIDVIGYLAKKGLRTTMITNGVNLSEKLRETIIREKVNVRISIYGHSAEVHDRVTGVAGSFKKSVASIQYFVAHNVHVSANVVLMRENEKYLHEIEDFLNALGVKTYKFDVIRTVFAGTQGEHNPVTEAVLRFGRLCQPKFKITENNFYNAQHYHPCWNRKLAIGEDGLVMPCVFARDIIVGDLKTQVLSEVVRSNELRSCWGLKMDDISQCSRCEFRYACKDCRPLAISVRNCRFDKMPKCDYDPISGVWKNGN